MTGRPVFAATTNGIVEFTPPASIGIVASAFLPWYFSRSLREATASSPLGILSIRTVGAPMIAVGITNQSSGTSVGSRSLTGPFFLIAVRAMSFPT